jgi:hypothetical protein
VIRECEIRGQESTSWLVRFYLSLTSIDANIDVSQDFGRSRGAVLGKAAEPQSIEGQKNSVYLVTVASSMEFR